MRELLARAVDFGCTFFDTAEAYGTPENPHNNEDIVGTALKPYRDKIVIETKFGIRFDETSHETNKPIVSDARLEVIKKSLQSMFEEIFFIR